MAGEDDAKPIELPTDLNELSRSYRFCLDVLELLKTGPTLKSLIEMLGPKHGLSPEQAEQVIGATLMQWVGLSRHNLLRDQQG